MQFGGKSLYFKSSMTTWRKFEDKKPRQMDLKCEEFWNSFPCESTKVSCHVDMFKSLKKTTCMHTTTTTSTTNDSNSNNSERHHCKRNAYTRTCHIANTFISNKTIVIAHGIQTKNVQLKCSLTICIYFFPGIVAVIVMCSQPSANS